jgi:hydrogenase maturation factor
VLELGDNCLVFKSDPITFATEAIGWYLVQVNSNDIVTTGATPRWLLLTMLLPENKSTPQSVVAVGESVFAACREMGISVLGGHTEITHGLERPILCGTLIGEVSREKLVTPAGMKPGDLILLTKGVPIEGTAILAREFPDRLNHILDQTQIAAAQNYLYRPGISVLRDAQIAQEVGQVTAMHDPTEGGLVTALWEMAEASGNTLVVDLSAVPISTLSRRICAAFDLDPLATIASGALLLTTTTADAPRIRQALIAAGIDCAVIGHVEEGSAAVWHKTLDGRQRLPRTERDEIGKVYSAQ